MVRIVLQLLKIASIALIAVLVVAGGARAFDYYLDEQRPNDIGRRFTVTVGEDDTVGDVAKALEERELVRFPWVFEGQVRVLNADLVPGRYELKKGMSARQLAEILTGNTNPNAPSAEESNEEPEEEEADDEEAEPFQLTVIEGFRTEEIAETLVDSGWNGSVEEFMQAVEEFPTDNYDFLASRENEVNPNSLEGFLFPDTYTINPDEPAQDIIQKMLDNFDARVTPDMRERAQQMDLSIYEVLIFASLIEREAQVGEERPVIADVYLNRYVEGWDLEADPTIRFAIGKRENGEWWDAVTAEELEETDSPYNTYLNAGLPPGPICNPSLDSIQAVLTPAGTDYMFFVAYQDDSGRHLFAVDDASHNVNVEFVNGRAPAPAPGSNPFETSQVTGQGGTESGEEIPIESTGG